MTITDTVYNIGKFSRDDGPKNYVSSSDMAVYVARGLSLVNKLLDGTVVFTVTQDTTGDDFVDAIIAEFACYFADLIYNHRQYDPESKKYLNPHWEVGMKLFLSVYGVENQKGKIVAPLYFNDSKACDNLGVARWDEE